MNRELVRVDKNGTSYYHCTDRCLKCGGTGIVRCYVHVNGGECFDCGGSGISEWEEKEYTPEYEAKLAAQREKREAKRLEAAKAQATEKNAEFFSKNGFTAEGKTYFVLGNTYDIKEELKAQGAKWDNVSRHWHMANPYEGLNTLQVSVEEMYVAGYGGIYSWNSWIRSEWDDPEYYPNKIQAAEDRLKAKASTSQHVGKVGKKYTAVMTYIHTASWENGYGGYWNSGVTNLHTFKDEQGNVFVWKTDKYIEADYGTKLTVSGTVKEHSDYKGINQTVLTRCKVEEVR